MTVYWIVWASVILIAALISKAEIERDTQLTVKRRYHSGTEKWLFIIATLLLIFIAGCRNNVGDDFGSYYNNYTTYMHFWDALISFKEPGLHFVYSIAAMIHNTGRFCLFAVAAVTIGLQMLTLYRNTNNIALALVLYTFMFWTACFNGVRQALAAAVLFCGFSALRDKKFFKFFVIVILAFLCHRSAIIMVLMYFMAHRRISIRNVIILITASVIVLLSYDYVFQFTGLILEEDILATKSTYWMNAVNPLRVLSRTAPAVFFLYVCRNKEKTEELSFYLNLLIIGAVVSIVTMNSTAMGRMSLYMTLFMIISIVELIKVVESRYTKLLTIAIVLLYGFMEWYEIQGSVSLNNFQLEWLW